MSNGRGDVPETGSAGQANRTPGQDTLALERSILGACIRDPDNLIDLLGIPVEYFGSEEHRELCEILQSMHKEDTEVDVLTVQAEFQRRKNRAITFSELAGMANESIGMNMRGDLELLEANWRRRRVLSVARSIARDVDEGLPPEEVTAKAVDSLTNLSRPIDETAHEFWGVLNTVLLEGEAGLKTEAIPTGLRTLDIPLGSGLRRKTVTVIGARTSMGKSALAHQIALHAATREKKRVLLFSVEMPKEAFARRTIAQAVGIEPTVLRRLGLTPESWRRTRADLESQYAGSLLYINDDAAMTSGKAAAIARKMKMTKGLDVVIVDYIQRLSDTPVPGENRNQMLGRVSRTFAILARQLDAVVILVSQLNRASDRTSDGRPKLSDLRDSGEIEQDADNVFLLFRRRQNDPEANEHEAEVNIAKQREGPTMVRRLYWDGKKVRFFDLEEGREQA